MSLLYSKASRQQPLSIVEGFNGLTRQLRGRDGIELRDVKWFRSWASSLGTYFRRTGFDVRLTNLLGMTLLSGGHLSVSGPPRSFLTRSVDMLFHGPGSRPVNFRGQPYIEGPFLRYVAGNDCYHDCISCLQGDILTDTPPESIMAHFGPAEGYVVDLDSADHQQRAALGQMLTDRLRHQDHFGDARISPSAFVITHRQDAVEDDSPELGIHWSYQGIWRPNRKVRHRLLPVPSDNLIQGLEYARGVCQRYWTRFRDVCVEMADRIWRAFNWQQGYVLLQDTYEYLARTLSFQALFGSDREPLSDRLNRVHSMVEAVLRHRLQISNALPFRPQNQDLRYLGFSKVRSHCLTI